jgi:hypothetical protein
MRRSPDKAAEAPEPEEAGSGLFSIRMMALAAYLKGRCDMSFGALKAFFHDMMRQRGKQGGGGEGEGGREGFPLIRKDGSHPWIAEQVKYSIPQTYGKIEWNGRNHSVHRYKRVNGAENRADGRKSFIRSGLR